MTEFPFPFNFIAWGVVIVGLLAATLIIALVIDSIAYAITLYRVRRAVRRRTQGWHHQRHGRHAKDAYLCRFYDRHWHVGPIIVWRYRKGNW